MSTPELVRIFTAEDAHAYRMTVKDDIDVLLGEGFDIVTLRSRNHSFYLGSRKFDLPELGLLIDAVASCGFIDDKTSEKLIEKLKGMVSRHQAEKLKRHLYLPGDGTRQDYYTAIAITDAINAGEKIFFQYPGCGGKICTVSHMRSYAAAATSTCADLRTAVRLSRDSALTE